MTKILSPFRFVFIRGQCHLELLYCRSAMLCVVQYVRRFIVFNHYEMNRSRHQYLSAGLTKGQNNCAPQAFVPTQQGASSLFRKRSTVAGETMLKKNITRSKECRFKKACFLQFCVPLIKLSFGAASLTSLSESLLVQAGAR